MLKSCPGTHISKHPFVTPIVAPNCHTTPRQILYPSQIFPPRKGTRFGDFHFCTQIETFNWLWYGQVSTRYRYGFRS